MENKEGLLLVLLHRFQDAARSDPRIAPSHISVYVALLHLWKLQACKSPLRVFAKEVMPLCKIFGSATYHRTIKALAECGYIRYEPSFNHYEGSEIWMER